MNTTAEQMAAEPDSGGPARIAVDISGGDVPLVERMAGAFEAVEMYRDVSLLLCGPADKLSEATQTIGAETDRTRIVDCPSEIGMHESPIQALRQKPDSSIAKGVQLLAEGKADAFVSAGNTGAVAAAAILKLGRSEGVHRPGIAAPMKVIDFPVVAIDVGANVDCKPINLLQYGIMASVFAEELLNIPNPRVGLLNIGEEINKGNELSKQSFELLESSKLNFIGNVEPKVLFHHGCDVLVCDGFVGNIVLKFSESLVLRLVEWIRAGVQDRFRYKLGIGLCKSLFSHLRHCADFTEYGGAPLLGVNGVVIITHGATDAYGIRNAVREARSFVQNHVGEHIAKAIRDDAYARSAAD